MPKINKNYISFSLELWLLLVTVVKPNGNIFVNKLNIGCAWNFGSVEHSFLLDFSKVWWDWENYHSVIQVVVVNDFGEFGHVACHHLLCGQALLDSIILHFEVHNAVLDLGSTRAEH